MSFDWHQENVDRLRALANSGLKLSATKIGRELGGATKNSVISAARRFGIQLGRTRGSSPASASAAPRKKPSAHSRARLSDPIVKAPDKPLPKFKAVGHGRIEIADLKEHHCRYPFGERGPYLFCGEAKLEGQSYCQAHFAKCTAART